MESHPVFNLQFVERWTRVNFAAQVYDGGDMFLARGSLDPNAIAEPNFEMEDTGAIELAGDSSFDQGDYDLLMGCQDPGVEDINPQFGKRAMKDFCCGLVVQNVDYQFQTTMIALA